MKYLKRTFYLAAFIIVICSCRNTQEPAVKNEELAIIPQPAQVKLNTGNFTIKKNTLVYCNSKDLLSVAKYMDAKLSVALGFTMQISEGTGKGINLVIPDIAEKNLGEEGYRLHVTTQNIEIIANKSNGIFYGIQTLLQMLPLKMKNCGIPPRN